MQHKTFSCREREAIKRQKINEITKEKEKKKQENQKNGILKRNEKNKDNKRKEKENMTGKTASIC